MAVDLDDLFRRGGKGLIDLLQFAVWTVQPEPIFVVLVQDYRGQATVPRALALFDVFCATGSPARIRVDDVLPPRDLRLDRGLRPLREALAAILATPADAEDRPGPPLPPRHLFNFVVERLIGQPDGPLAAIARQFDPERSPAEHMPGGRLTQGQRFFVEKVWRPSLRPRLLAAGFARVAALGG